MVAAYSFLKPKELQKKKFTTVPAGRLIGFDFHSRFYPNLDRVVKISDTNRINFSFLTLYKAVTYLVDEVPSQQ